MQTGSHPSEVREKQLHLLYPLAEIEAGDWDYANAETKTHTHGYHVYPAMMIPQVARRLIRNYAPRGGVLLDPFCGSGTSLVEARLAWVNSCGIDLNPFAVFLARAKTTLFHVHSILEWKRWLQQAVKHAEPVPIPRFYNIDYWFLPQVQQRLAILRHLIREQISLPERDFFTVAFAHTVRVCSNTRQGEYKLYRIPESRLHQHNPNVDSVFFQKVENNLQGLIQFLEEADPNTAVQVFQHDTRTTLPIEDKVVDVIVTSPPYGDSQTTVAYGQFSRLALQWLGFSDEEVKSIDRSALGGKFMSEQAGYYSATLDRVVETIGERDVRRARQVQQFYSDFALCLCEITRVAKTGAFGCFVVGNRTVKEVRIPTDQILVELAEHFGWKRHALFHRRIPNKRMPLKNSPTNQPGVVPDTMTEEHIVILKKE